MCFNGGEGRIKLCFRSAAIATVIIIIVLIQIVLRYYNIEYLNGITAILILLIPAFGSAACAG